MDKKIRIIKTFVSQSQQDGKEYLAMIREFDLNGNNVFTKEYDEENDVINENKFEFDSEGRILSEEILFGEKKFYSYDGDGRLISEKIVYDGGWYSIKSYEKDPNKPIIKVSCCDEDGELEEFTETEYNDNGEIVCHSEYDEEGKLKSKVLNTYRNDGLLSMKEEYADSKKPDKIHHYYYNAAGRIEAVQTLNSSGRQLDWVKIIFDESGRPLEQLTMSGAKIALEYDKEARTVTEIHYSASGEMNSKIKTTRDEEGNIITEESVGRVQRYVYEYF